MFCPSGTVRTVECLETGWNRLYCKPISRKLKREIKSSADLIWKPQEKRTSVQLMAQFVVKKPREQVSRLGWSILEIKGLVCADKPQNENPKRESFSKYSNLVGRYFFLDCSWMEKIFRLKTTGQALRCAHYGSLYSTKTVMNLTTSGRQLWVNAKHNFWSRFQGIVHLKHNSSLGQQNAARFERELFA